MLVTLPFIILWVVLYVVSAAIFLGLHLAFIPRKDKWSDTRAVMGSTVWPAYGTVLAWLKLAITVYKIVQQIRAWWHRPGGLFGREGSHETPAQEEEHEPLRAPAVVPAASIIPRLYDDEEAELEPEVEPEDEPKIASGLRRGHETPSSGTPIFHAGF